ncbi:hypothetical protein H8K35_00785 [Undibacterium sp. LX40W]|uniref:Uncharacterized protein n=1 Tax=Undibacterium nitidum TaxID=2762298 RepID=A0A923HMH3_9BURK|nr:MULTISPECIES: DUF6702 family protein [Undibacterium]MBC3881083.1 hypothetical protein [Undibacterium nitidum]MBC3890184.1 hypothetical protein [Undibacterium sp. LX40W]
MILSRIKIGVATALVLMSAAAFAHRFHAGITDISMNPRSGNTEIVHTFMAHDVEALLENLYQRQFDLSDPDDVQVFKKYFEKQFYILNPKQEKLDIKWVGLRVDPNSVFVFQEIEKQALAPESIVHQAVLTDFLVDQVNTLNINGVQANGKTVQTLTFHRAKREQVLP